MKTLILLRHAEAGPYQIDDHVRVLTDNGQAQARLSGEWLKAQGYKPDFYLCSTAARTRETLAGALEASGFHPKGDTTDDLYNHKPADYLQVIRELGRGDTLLLVGHNPDICQLAMILSGATDVDLHDFPKGSVAVLTTDIDNWSNLRARSATLTAHFIPA